VPYNPTPFPFFLRVLSRAACSPCGQLSLYSECCGGPDTPPRGLPFPLRSRTAIIALPPSNPDCIQTAVEVPEVFFLRVLKFFNPAVQPPTPSLSLPFVAPAPLFPILLKEFFRKGKYDLPPMRFLLSFYKLSFLPLLRCWTAPATLWRSQFKASPLLAFFLLSSDMRFSQVPKKFLTFRCTSPFIRPVFLGSRFLFLYHLSRLPTVQQICCSSFFLFSLLPLVLVVPPPKPPPPVLSTTQFPLYHSPPEDFYFSVFVEQDWSDKFIRQYTFFPPPPRPSRRRRSLAFRHFLSKSKVLLPFTPLRRRFLHPVILG